MMVEPGFVISPRNRKRSPRPGDIRFKDLNGDGVINADDRTFIGNTLAKQIVGLNGGIRYRNFDLSLVVTGDFGRYQGIFASGFAAARAAESTRASLASAGPAAAAAAAGAATATALASTRRAGRTTRRSAATRAALEPRAPITLLLATASGAR